METLSTDKYKKLRTVENERNKYQQLAQELQRAVNNEQEMREMLVREIEDMKQELEEMRAN
jgi:chaperonin cofactor prefoldin